jgi:Predicted carbamoyl transferase, NodU family
MDTVTGVKHKGGFDNAVRYLLPNSSFPYSDDIDVIAVSTCCEAREAAMLGHAFEGDPRLVPIGHHDSHAALAYFMSGLDSALIVVADGGGNTVGAAADTDQWWTSQREQVSYYEAVGGRISLIDRDFFEPYEAGLAEIYRAFTYHLGWHSYVHASRTMALAGINTDGVVARWPALFHISAEHLRSPISNDPLDPIAMVRRIGDVLRIPVGEPRAPHAPVTLVHARIAAYVQRCLEDALAERIRRLAKATGLTSVCLGGGVALNAVSNAKLAEATGCHIFVPVAPGDDGQAVGNILAVLHDRHLLKAPRGRFPSTPFLGPEPAPCSASISEGISRHALDAVVVDGGDVAAHIAAAVAGGELVCLYEGRSELGPRALGHRSILGDPRYRQTATMLNDLKGRPQFMPFAPVMHAGEAARIFGATTESPYMSFAPFIGPANQRDVAGVVHADGTSRVQTISPTDNSTLSRALTLFGACTGVEALVNTSFNVGGAPIVETVDQALAVFKQLTTVPSLVLGRFIVLRDGAWQSRLNLSGLTIKFDKDRGLRGTGGDALEQDSSADAPKGDRYQLTPEPADHLRAVRQIRVVTGCVVYARSQLPLLSPYVRLLRRGAKVTTIRFRRGGVELPFERLLPVIENDEACDRNRGAIVGFASIGAVTYKRFQELDETDARHDGFSAVDEMREALRAIYPRIEPENWVSVFGIESFTPKDSVTDALGRPAQP